MNEESQASIYPKVVYPYKCTGSHDPAYPPGDCPECHAWVEKHYPGFTVEDASEPVDPPLPMKHGGLLTIRKQYALKTADGLLLCVAGTAEGAIGSVAYGLHRWGYPGGGGTREPSRKRVNEMQNCEHGYDPQYCNQCFMSARVRYAPPAISASHAPEPPTSDTRTDRANAPTESSRKQVPGYTQDKDGFHVRNKDYRQDPALQGLGQPQQDAPQQDAPIPDDLREAYNHASRPTHPVDVQAIVLIERIGHAEAQLADRDNHINLAYKALGDVNRGVYLFDHIQQMKATQSRSLEDARREGWNAAIEASVKVIQAMDRHRGGWTNSDGDYHEYSGLVQDHIRALAKEESNGN